MDNTQLLTTYGRDILIASFGIILGSWLLYLIIGPRKR